MVWRRPAMWLHQSCSQRSERVEKACSLGGGDLVVLLSRGIFCCVSILHCPCNCKHAAIRLVWDMPEVRGIWLAWEDSRSLPRRQACVREYVTLHGKYMCTVCITSCEVLDRR